MSKFKTLIKEHAPALLIAFITAFLCAAPQLYFRIDHGELYQGDIEPIENLVSSNWSPRVREVMDGHPNWGSIYFKDGKDDPYLFQPLGAIVVAYTGMSLGLDINDTILLSRILFPFIVFLLMYSFTFLLTRHKLVALASTSAILLVDFLLSPSGIKSVITGDLLNQMSSVNFLEISHPVNSMMIFLFFFGFLVSLFLFYEKKKLVFGITSSILLGLNFYNYFYSWTFLFAFGGVLTVILFSQKKWEEGRRIMYVFMGGLLVALPYLWNLYSATLHTNYEALSMRHGVLVSHAPLFIGSTAFVALIIFLIGFPRTDKSKYIFALAILLTPFVTLNQQILTGKMLQVGHYHWYMHKPFAIIFLTAVVFYTLEKWQFSRPYKKIIAISIILVSVVMGAKIQQVSYMKTNLNRGGDSVGVTLERQKYARVMDWLNAHAEKESVVFANEETSNVVVIYTPQNVFHHHADHLTLPATDERLRTIVFTYYRLRDVGAENIRSIFEKEKEFLSARLFGIHYREKEGREADLPDDVVQDLVYKYQESLKIPTNEWLYDVWKQYEVEYVVWDKKADPTWELGEYTFLKEEAVFGDFVIYRFQQETKIEG